MLGLQRIHRVVKQTAPVTKRFFGGGAAPSPAPAVSSVSAAAQRTASVLATSSPSVVDESAAPPAESSLWQSWFGTKSKYKSIPLNQVYPTAPIPTTTSLPVLDPDAHVTTLPNGLRIVTKAHFSPIASVGVFIDAGSRYEANHHLAGLPHFFEFLALKSTKNRSDFRLIRDLQKLGVNIMMSAQREHIIYAGDVARHNVDQLVGTLADLIQYHALDPTEISATQDLYAHETAQRDERADITISEAIHEAAYFNNTLGLPLIAPPTNIGNFNRDTIQNFLKTYFTPKRMVISGVGVDHAELVDLVSRAFVDLPADTLDISSRQPAQYTGGEVRMHQRGRDGPAHFALAFETASWHSPDLIPMCLLQTIMGGGGSFSQGGPGKGMHTRLYSNVLNQHGWVESANSSDSIFSDTALFILYGSTRPDKMADLVNVLTQEALGMTGPIDPLSLQRAKNALKSGISLQYESRGAILEDIGRQIMLYGKVRGVDEICKQIDATKAEDIIRVAKKILSSKPSVAGFGDLSSMPRYDHIERLLRQ